MLLRHKYSACRFGSAVEERSVAWVQVTPQLFNISVRRLGSVIVSVEAEEEEQLSFVKSMSMSESINRWWLPLRLRVCREGRSAARAATAVHRDIKLFERSNA